MQGKNQKQQLIFAIYWFMLAYVVAALVWWFIALTIQNNATSEFRIADLPADHTHYALELKRIEQFRERKFAQYTGEGITFLLIIMGAAIFIFRAVRRQFKQGRQQQTFMMAITHELKTPVAVAQLNLETLNKHKLEKPQKEKLLSNTLQEIKRLNLLCNNLLVSSQLEQGGYVYAYEDVNTAEFLEEIVENFNNRFPSRPIEWKVDESAAICVDLHLMQMAINNVFENAFKYSKGIIRLSAEKNNSMLMIKILDEGPGIPDEDKKSVFNKYYRLGNEATRTSKGTGLGLFIARRIINAHKGKIFIENNHPQGATFNIVLPLNKV
ncbi:MAG: HAMP domain-containing histidine kinase [Chitinophagaceae bacterium]|nr:MAG: HAMP domain-containing histidine kinase [Chitinophagaceae bacterium]